MHFPQTFHCLGNTGEAKHLKSVFCFDASFRITRLPFRAHSIPVTILLSRYHSELFLLLSHLRAVASLRPDSLASRKTSGNLEDLGPPLTWPMCATCKLRCEQCRTIVVGCLQTMTMVCPCCYPAVLCRPAVGVVSICRDSSPWL